MDTKSHLRSHEMDDAALKEYLREYYGRTLQKTEDLETRACCANTTSQRFAALLESIPDEVKSRNYGCGCPIPLDDLTGLMALDLGSGAGLDSFILSRVVGATGFVHGIDMTGEQLAVARRNRERVALAFGYRNPNTEFHEDYLETAASIESSSMDLVVSNCAINLSPFKDRVFQTIFRVLKP